jgi:cytochrome P450
VVEIRVPSAGVAANPGPDLASAASIRDPTGYFQAHRDRSPILWSDAQRGWVIVGHAAAQEAFSDRKLLSADRIGPLERFAAAQPAAFGRVVGLLRGWMIFRDPPAHTRLREPVRRAFTPRHVAELRTTIAEIAGRLVSDLEEARGEVDLHSAFARPFPALVIGALLGLEDVDPSRLQDWSDTLASIVFAVSPSSQAPIDAVVAAADAFEEFFGPLVAAARRGTGDDLIAQVARLDDAEFSDRELVGLCTMLLFAGHETTTGLLTNSLAWMLDDTSVIERYSAGDHDLRAVDELLRVCGPARMMVRKASVDHDRGGCRLRAGENVFISIAAANHDPEVFEDPAQLRLDRDPNPHLGFGWGLHHCLGAHLARLESAVALRLLVDRFPLMRAVEPVPAPTASALGLMRMPGPVRLHP